MRDAVRGGLQTKRHTFPRWKTLALVPRAGQRGPESGTSYPTPPMTPETKFIKRPAARADWLAARRGYVGGSEVAALLNLSPWKSAVDVWRDKTGATPPEEASSGDADLDATLPLRLGNYLEQFAATEYALRTGREVRNYGYMIARGHALADVDRLVVPDGAKVASFHAEIRTSLLLEIKTTAHGEKFAEGIPDNYDAQVQQYMELADVPACDVAVLILAPRAAFKIFRVERDRAIGAGLVARIEAFWRGVDEGQPPPCATLADARALYPRGGMEPRAASPEIAEAIAELRGVEAQSAELDARRETLRARIADYMGDADTLTVDGVKAVTFKAPKPRRVVDWKGVAEELGRTEEPAHVAAVRERHTTETPGARRFVLAPWKAISTNNPTGENKP